MPTLCIPRRKSILIETIHHSREPTDESFFFFDHGEEQLRTFMLGSLQLQTQVDRFGASTSSSLCRPRFPLGFNFTGFRGISVERSVLVYLRLRSVCPRSLFFLRPVELCVAGFASFRGIPVQVATQREDFSTDDIAFR